MLLTVTCLTSMQCCVHGDRRLCLPSPERLLAARGSHVYFGNHGNQDEWDSSWCILILPYLFIPPDVYLRVFPVFSFMPHFLYVDCSNEQYQLTSTTDLQCFCVFVLFEFVVLHHFVDTVSFEVL